MSIPRHNNMTKLLNKIEGRIGTKMLSLPDKINKDTWGSEVIAINTLDTFSRFFPNKITYSIDLVNDKGRDGYFYLDQDLFEGVEILGIRDLCLDNYYKNTCLSNNDLYGYDIAYSMEDIAMAQMEYDARSLIDTNVYVDFIPPNKIKVEVAGGFDVTSVNNKKLDVEVFIKHAESLATIEPTKMETFEKLAKLDIEIYLYNALKHFNNLETIFINTDMKIDDWASAESERDDLVKELEDKYVSAANKNQPMMITI